MSVCSLDLFEHETRKQATERLAQH
jgi:hypothetical protein